MPKQKKITTKRKRKDPYGGAIISGLYQGAVTRGDVISTLAEGPGRFHQFGGGRFVFASNG